MKLVRRLTLTLLAGIAVVYAAETYLIVQQFIHFYDADTRRDLRVIERVLSAEIEKAWPEDGLGEVMRLIQEADDRDDSLQLSWVPFDAGPPRDLPPAQADALLARMNEGRSFVHFEETGEGALHTYLPVRVNDSLVGAIRVSESASAKNDFVQARILQRVSTALVVVVMCGLFAWIAGARLVGRPVGQLMALARRIGSGDFSGRLRLAGGDELAGLAQHMNAMAEALERSQQALDAQTAARLDALEQLRHADRLKTIGTLASGVAHELGTPMSVVSGRAQTIVAGEVTDPDEVIEAARVIRSQTDRMANIVRQLLDFARLRKADRKASDLARISLDAVGMLQPLARKRGVEIEVTGADRPLVADVDPAALGQAVTNVVMNALQATTTRGTVGIRLERATAATPGTTTAPRACACIVVLDQGPGIPPDQLPQIFDPFFTTKEVGQGTGLGLSVAHGIVAAAVGSRSTASWGRAPGSGSISRWQRAHRGSALRPTSLLCTGTDFSTLGRQCAAHTNWIT